MGKKKKAKQERVKAINPIVELHKLVELTVRTINENITETPEKLRDSCEKLSVELERALALETLSPDNYYDPIEKEVLPEFVSLSDFIKEDKKK